MATAASNSPLGSSATINYGIPDTSQGATFELEEQAAAAARGESFTQLWAGFKLPPSLAGDFWQMYAQAETFAANTGWKYLPTPQQLVSMVENGYATADTQTVMSHLAKLVGIQNTMPWASVGMSQQTYEQQSANLQDSIYALTGKPGAAEAGLGGIVQQALAQGWTQQHLQNYIQQNPTLNKDYGYLQYGYNYNTFEAYKATNAAALKERYGAQYTSQNAIQSLGDPQTAFHAQGGTFGEFQPYVQSQTTIPTGRQSSVR